ncbi:P-loop containing nucleoside triphosphate hydrolase protein [Syncephalis plumigaleata]|nr:P-loop containing nucleoside triphosphate hydrolase protein [Syncephalis plumigaleata]
MVTTVDTARGDELRSVNIARTDTRATHNRPTEELQLVFRNLRYSVPVIDPATKKPSTKTILNGVTGAFNPGKLTVILGSSGAGKTSLLNVLAGESTTNAGKLTGELLVNGQPTTGHEIRKMAGYVYQDDIIYHTMTVREAIMFSAQLRVSKKVPDDVKRERVEDLLTLLHLTKASDTLIGNDRIKGVSGGERKRASIAMELVTNPGILFLDEPTSGLDSYTALTVMRILKELAEAGHTVVATLHQPSSEIFHLIDDLMLMADGRILYMGEAAKSIEYFARQGYRCPQYSNPADFFFMSIFHKVDLNSATNPAFLSNNNNNNRSSNSNRSSNDNNNDNNISSVITSHTARKNATADIAAAHERLQELLDYWLVSPEGADMQRVVDSPHSGGFSESNRKYRSSFVEQFPLILKRAAKNVLRDKLVLAAKLAQTLVFAIIFDLIYWQIPNRAQASQIQDRSGVLFFYAANLVMSNAMGVLTVFSMERSTFARENHSGLYGLPAFFFSKLAVELPVYMITPTVLITATYWAIGLHHDAGRFFLTCLISILLSGAGMSIGVAAASFFNELSVALAVVPTLILPMMIFGGLFANISTLPVWIRWLKWLSLMKYGFVALAKNEFLGLTIGCGDDVPADACRPLDGHTVVRNLGIEDQGTVWVNIAALAAWWIALTAFSYFGLWRMIRSGRGGRKIKKE